jgi:hypothetical protein
MKSKKNNEFISIMFKDGVREHERECWFDEMKCVNEKSVTVKCLLEVEFGK